MSSFDNALPFVGPLPYHLVSRLCQAQAQLHTQQLLEQKFPTLTDADWSNIFAERRPLLWVDEATKTIIVADEFLPDLTSWAAMYENSRYEPRSTQTENEARYLARQLVTYSEIAREQVTLDPELTQPNSLWRMQEVFFRLSVGNVVAERLSQPFERLGIGAG